MADGDAVGGFEAGKVPALHATREPFALADAADINLLANREVGGRQRGAWVQQRVSVDPEFHQLRLRLHLRLGEMAAIGLTDILDLRLTPTELDGVIPILLLSFGGDDLQLVQM